MNDQSMNMQDPPAKRLQQELIQATTINDLFGTGGLFATLFASALKQMLEAELTMRFGSGQDTPVHQHLGNICNDIAPNLHKSTANVTPTMSREANVTPTMSREQERSIQSRLPDEQPTRMNDVDTKIIDLYAKGMSTSTIQSILRDQDGVEVALTTVHTAIDQAWPMVEAWQGRTLSAIYPIVYVDALLLKLHQHDHIINSVIYVLLGINIEGRRDVLGHWIDTGADKRTFWLQVATHLHARGVEDIFIACHDGLTDFEAALQSVFPRARSQRCIIQLIRHSLVYVMSKDRQRFAADIRTICQAETREAAESILAQFREQWGTRYIAAVKLWDTHWEEVATIFAYGLEIRRLMYTINTVETYNEQMRKVIQTHEVFPSVRAALQLLYLANRKWTRTWKAPVCHAIQILNQLTFQFDGRTPA